MAHRVDALPAILLQNDDLRRMIDGYVLLLASNER